MGKKKFKKECKGCEKVFVAMNVRKIYCSSTCKARFHSKKPKKEYLHKCLVCENSFTSSSKNTKFCSFVCAGKHKNKVGVGNGFCRNCDKRFLKKHSKHFFCSGVCKNKYGHSHAKKEIRICSNCDKRFERNIYAHRNKNTFCSKNCESRFRESEADDVKNCEHCEMEFLSKKGSKQRFCSMKCQGKWQSKTRTGVNSSNYDSTFSEEERVRRCTICGKEYRIKRHKSKTTKYCSRKCKINGQGFTMTSPHRKTVKILRENRIWYRNEETKGRYLIDIFLGKRKGIEVMGSYWHGDIRKYPIPKNKIQKNADKRDRRKKIFLEEENITVLYIWEDDIEKNSEMCEKLILKFIEKDGVLLNYHSMNYKVDRGRLVLNRERLVPRFER